MATAAEIKTKILPRLARKALQEVEWSDIAQAFGGAPQATRNQLVLAVRTRNGRAYERIFDNVMGDWAMAAAGAEADAMLADSALSFDELERVYGPF